MTPKTEHIALREVSLVIFCGLLLACKAGQPTASAKQAASASTSGSANAYRGVKWGATEVEAGRIVQFSECHDGEPDSLLKQPRRYCTSAFKLGDVRVEDEFFFLGGRFLAGFGHFPSDDFTAVHQAFVAKYGRPDNESSDQLFWNPDRNGVFLNRPDGTSGEFSIMSRELLERNEKADAEKAQEAKKAL